MTYGYDPAVGTARSTELEESLKRLKNEHDELLIRLSHIEASAKRADASADARTAAAELRTIRQPLAAFTAELERHAAWEEDELIPLIDAYFARRHQPTMTESIWVMEKDHELGNVYLTAFLERLDGLGEAPNVSDTAEAIHCLIQACALLKDHFGIEERTLFPLADEVLTDMDYLFS